MINETHEQKLMRLLRWAYNRVDRNRKTERRYLEINESSGSTWVEEEYPESEEIRGLLGYNIPPY